MGTGVRRKLDARMGARSGFIPLRWRWEFPMTVRRKTLLIIAITCLGLVVVLYSASRWFLLGGFIRLEQTYAKENMQRVLNAMDQDLDMMDRITAVRAANDQTYKGVSPLRPEVSCWLFGEDATGTTQTRRFNFNLLVDTSGHVLAYRGLDLTTKQPIQIPESLKTHFSRDDLLIRSAEKNGTVSGLLLIPEGPLLVISRPVVPSNSAGPVRGYIISARYFDSAGDLKSLQKTINFPLSIYRADGERLSADFSEARRHLSANGSIYVHSINETTMGGYALLNDIYGQPALNSANSPETYTPGREELHRSEAAG